MYLIIMVVVVWVLFLLSPEGEITGEDEVIPGANY